MSADFKRWLDQGIQRLKDAKEWHPMNETERQNLTPEQYNKFCHIHDKLEEDNGYHRCFECGHLYLTSDELVTTYNDKGLDVHNALKDPYMIEHELDIGKYRPAELKDIFFCPHCLHDF